MKTILINYKNDLYVKTDSDEHTLWTFLINNVKTPQQIDQYLQDAEMVDNANVFDFDKYFRFEDDGTWSLYDEDFNYWFIEDDCVVIPENHDELLREALQAV